MTHSQNLSGENQESQEEDVVEQEVSDFKRDKKCFCFWIYITKND